VKACKSSIFIVRLVGKFDLTGLPGDPQQRVEQIRQEIQEATRCTASAGGRVVELLLGKHYWQGSAVLCFGFETAVHTLWGWLKTFKHSAARHHPP
jgi:hypothetical protein